MYDVCVVDLEFVMMYDVLGVCFNNNNNNNNNNVSYLFRTLFPIGELPPSSTDIASFVQCGFTCFFGKTMFVCVNRLIL